MQADYPAAEAHFLPPDRFGYPNKNGHVAIVIHKTGGDATPERVEQNFLNSGESVHYAIGQDGRVWQFILESSGAGTMMLQQSSTLRPFPGILILFRGITRDAGYNQITNVIHRVISIITAKRIGMIYNMLSPFDFLMAVITLALLPIILLTNLFRSMYPPCCSFPRPSIVPIDSSLLYMSLAILLIVNGIFYQMGTIVSKSLLKHRFTPSYISCMFMIFIVRPGVCLFIFLTIFIATLFTPRSQTSFTTYPKVKEFFCRFLNLFALCTPFMPFRQFLLRRKRMLLPINILRTLLTRCLQLIACAIINKENISRSGFPLFASITPLLPFRLFRRLFLICQTVTYLARESKAIPGRTSREEKFGGSRFILLAVRAILLGYNVIHDRKLIPSYRHRPGVFAARAGYSCAYFCSNYSIKPPGKQVWRIQW